MEIHKSILDFLYNYSQTPFEINRLIVSSFIDLNELNLKNNVFLNKLYISNTDEDFPELEKFIHFFNSNNQDFSFEQLIKIFEFVISPSEKIINGAVYTPKNIRCFIVEKASENLTRASKIGDISCGCGGFLFDYAILIRENFSKSFMEIFSDNIFGIDIAEYSIQRTKILLSLLALSYQEDEEQYEFNLFIGDSLEFNWLENSPKIRANNGFDIIIGNPPYVGSQNLDVKTKKILKNWQVTKTGKADLYIPFFEIGLSLLKENGILGYITVNTFLKSLNGRALRSFFSDNQYEFRIIDFGGEQIFKERLTYTAICFLKKRVGNISYLKRKSCDIDSINDTNYSLFDYEFLDSFNGWNLNSSKVEENIKKIQDVGLKLGELFQIRNGFATLKNKIYLFKPIKEDAGFYYLDSGNIIYPIEKSICREAIKPNVLKSENEIKSLTEKIIFPYDVNDSLKNSSKVIVPIEETFFKKNYPKAYKYLCANKEVLSQRDKGNKKYQFWYIYGRNQALNIRGKKLLFPYISNHPYFVYTDNEDLLFYNGYAIISNDEQELLFLQKILNSKVFWYYIKNTSKPYSSNYYSFAKNYIKDFSIPEFTKKEKRTILNYKNNSSIDRFLFKKYGIEI